MKTHLDSNEWDTSTFWNCVITSPDDNPLNFYFFRPIKDLVYVQVSNNRADLMETTKSGPSLLYLAYEPKLTFNKDVGIFN